MTVGPMYPPREHREYQAPSELQSSVGLGFMGVGFGVLIALISQRVSVSLSWIVLGAIWLLDAALITKGLQKKARVAIRVACAVAGGRALLDHGLARPRNAGTIAGMAS